MLGNTTTIFIPLAFFLFPTNLTLSLAFFGSIPVLFFFCYSHPSFKNKHFSVYTSCVTHPPLWHFYESSVHLRYAGLLVFQCLAKTAKTNIHEASFQNQLPCTEKKKWNNTEDRETRERECAYVLSQVENWTGSCLLDWALAAHKATRKHLMQKEQNRASRNIKTSKGNMYKSNLQEIEAHGWMLSFPSSPDACLRRYPPYRAAIKFMCVVFVSRWHFPFSLFARLILSICPSKMFFHPKHLKWLYTLIDLCYAVLLVTFMHWCDFFLFSGSIIYLP